MFVFAASRRSTLLGVLGLALLFVVPMIAWTQTGVLFVKDNKVGIGTGTPGTLLDVVGGPGGSIARVSGGAHEVVRTDGPAANIRFRIANGSLTQSWLFSNDGSSGSFAIVDETKGNSPVIIRPNGTGATLFVSNGRLGIRTTNPQAELDVNGQIYQRGALLHADYVFDPSYTIESIEEHAALMWSERHLPAVPEARTDENGLEIIELGNHRRGMLEELEKAHVYIEQLHERLGEQEKMIQELAARLNDLEQTPR